MTSPNPLQIEFTILQQLEPLSTSSVLAIKQAEINFGGIVLRAR